MPPSIRASGLADFAPRVVELEAMRRRSAIARDWRHTISGRLGLGCAVLVVFAALFGGLLAPYDPFVIAGGSLVPPSRGHLMGTDALGRDVLSGVLFGARSSLFVAGSVGLIALAVGCAVGMVAGYRGGWVDDALMRITELFQVIPRFFFAVIAIALFGPGTDRLILTLGITSWPMLARVVRSEVIVMRELDYVRASKAMGAGAAHIAWRQLAPNLAPTVAVSLGLLIGQVLLLDATLGFLGLGDPTAVSWGMMASQAQGLLRVAWWLGFFPGLAITITVLSANLLADALSAERSGV